MTPLMVLENGGVFQKTGAFVVWGWSRRTGGQALRGGADGSTRRPHENCNWGKTGTMFMGFFTPESFF